MRNSIEKTLAALAALLCILALASCEPAQDIDGICEKYFMPDTWILTAFFSEDAVGSYFTDEEPEDFDGDGLGDSPSIEITTDPADGSLLGFEITYTSSETGAVHTFACSNVTMLEWDEDNEVLKDLKADFVQSIETDGAQTARFAYSLRIILQYESFLPTHWLFSFDFTEACADGQALNLKKFDKAVEQAANSAY